MQIDYSKDKSMQVDYSKDKSMQVDYSKDKSMQVDYSKAEFIEEATIFHEKNAFYAIATKI